MHPLFWVHLSPSEPGVLSLSNGGAARGQHHLVQQSGQRDPLLQAGHQDGSALPDSVHRSVKLVDP